MFWLMIKDVCIASINGEMCRVFREDLLPVELYGVPFTRMAFDSWCATRLLPLSRKHAKKIYNALMLQQTNSIIERARYARMYACLSLHDCYWVRSKKKEDSWSDVNLYTNSLSDALVEVSLLGRGITLQRSKIKTPDISEDGTYAKAWIRTNGLMLLKAGETDEVYREVLASKVLDCFGIDHVVYEEYNFESVTVSACRCMTSEEKSFTTFAEFKSFCRHAGMNAIEEVKKIDASGYYQLCLATYLIGNTDLHDNNWGLNYNPDTWIIGNREFVGVSTLFDFNNAFDPYFYDSEDGGNWIPGIVVIDEETGKEITDNYEDYDFTMIAKQSMKEAALEAAEYVTLKQVRPIQRAWFESEKLLSAFKHRCHVIGLNPILS